MSSETVVGLMTELMKAALLLSLPLLATILLVGLVVSILQVVTQVQDPSIAFIPKLIAFSIVLVLLAPWMLEKLSAFGVTMFAQLAR